MPSSYPGNPDNLPANHLDGVNETILALHVNRLDEAMNAVQAELGNLPSSSYPTVRARLDATGSGLPSNSTDRDLLTVDSTDTVRWSAKAAPYNICENTGSTPGADPTGSVDATAAINAVVAAAADKGAVFCPPGLYNIATTNGVQMVSDSHLYGVRGQTTFRAANGLAGGRVLQNSGFGASGGISRVMIEGIEFDLNSANRAFTGSTQIAFRGTDLIKNFDITVRRCHVHHGNSLGIGFEYADNVRVQDNRVHDMQRDAIGFYESCRYVDVTGNRCYLLGDDAIAVSGGCKDVSVIGNTIGGGFLPQGSSGVAVRAAERVAVMGNTIIEPFSNGICVLDDDTDGRSARDITIVGNVIRDIGLSNTDTSSAGQKGNGILLEAGFASGTGGLHTITVANNIVDRPRAWGIVLSADTGTLVQNVTIQGNQFFGGSAFPTNHGAYFAGNLNTGFNFVRFLGNFFRDWQGSAIDMQTSGPLWVDIIGNMMVNNCKGTPASAINLGAANHVMVIGNRVTDTQATKTTQYGVNYGTATEVYVASNNFQGVLNNGRIGTKTATIFEHANVDFDGAFCGGDHNTTVL